MATPTATRPRVLREPELQATTYIWGDRWWHRHWAAGYGWQEVETREAAVEAAVYTIGNPVRAGLVASPRAWPGLITTPEQLTVTRPRAFQTFTKPGRLVGIREAPVPLDALYALALA